MIRKIRGWIKDKAGVSPIIAIILMVAITVVLAATIYVWVSGMGKTGTSTPNLSAIVDNANDKVVITSAETGLDWSDIKIVWSADSGVTVDSVTVKTATGTSIGTPSNGGAVTTSATAVNAGDYIEISATGSGDVEITLIYTPTNTQLGSWTVNV